jgi:prolycopene isomerase
VRLFPGEARGLRNLVDVSLRIAREAQAFAIAPTAFDLLSSVWRFPTLVRYRNATLQRMLDRELTDRRLKALYASLLPWIGLPPERASFLMWGAMMGHYVEGGTFYCRGSFQSLADAVARGLALAGGELALETRVSRIVAVDRRVRGVTLDTGQEVRAPVVISNADARDTFQALLDPAEVPTGYLTKLRRLEPSMSVMALYLGTDLDARALGGAHETNIYTSWDLRQGYADAYAGEVSALSMVIPSLTDPSRAPAREHVVILQALVPSDGAREETVVQDRLASGMLVLAEQVLPGLGEHLTFIDEASPGADGRFSLRRLGPMYGWAISPKQSGSARLPHRTPLAGLWLAGHWTQPTHGIIGVVESGVRAARLILGVAPRAGVSPLRLPPSGAPGPAPGS